jgi:hypothetical protein
LKFGGKLSGFERPINPGRRNEAFGHTAFVSHGAQPGLPGSLKLLVTGLSRDL